MIAYLEGKLAEKNPTYFVIEVGGVGFLVHIPESSYDASQAVGDRIKMLTHLHVREDALALYGFSTEAERDLFEILIGVSGIGPPMAQRILSGMSIVDFKRFVLAEDARGLMQIKGIGQKMAQRLVLELRDKMGAIVPDAGEGAVPMDGKAMSVLEEATTALVGLGATPLRARRVVVQVLRGESEELSVEEVIKRSLRQI
ncbi:MAG: Holliday junction branch migration protein RuvA [bacterium]|nr:Holliday junction branch migration protein RuvA [bacterium]